MKESALHNHAYKYALQVNVTRLSNLEEGASTRFVLPLAKARWYWKNPVSQFMIGKQVSIACWK